MMPSGRRILPWRRSPRRVAIEIQELVSYYRDRHPSVSTELIERSFAVAEEAHRGQKRVSGDQYIRHPVAVATIVAKLGLDDATVAAALLHDTVEDTDMTLDDIREHFGDDVASMVDGVTKLDRLNYQTREQQQAASVRKMMVAVAQDLRVLIIKLADRLHNLRTLAVMPEFKQQNIARETLDVYAPLAHRLGMQGVKQQLEDLAFAAFEPRRYAEIDEMVHQRSPERDKYLAQLMQLIDTQLTEMGVKAELQGRPKHLWSIYEKMVVKGRPFDEIFDLVGIRVLVADVKDCYAALGCVHAIWRPVHGRFKDYIAMPKFNLYQSLHTTVVGMQGKALEVQIRTHDMHARAEHGVAAHWQYKKGGSSSQDMAWLSRIIDWEQDTSDPAEFMENLKIDLDTDEVYVFTPKGKVIELPVGATPVDFAYSIHTEVGHTCVGSKVNGKLVPIDTRLVSGDMVEILTSKNEGAGPSRDWLRFVASRRATHRIKQWYLRERRSDAIEHGKEDLIQALRREGLPARRLLKDRDNILTLVVAHLHYSDNQSMFAAIGEGHQSAMSVAARFAKELRGVRSNQQLPSTSHLRNSSLEQRLTSYGGGVHVEGLDDILVRLSQCCMPVPPDEIVGYVTRGRGVSVHRADCANAVELVEGKSERLIEVEWNAEHGGSFSAIIMVYAIDRAGLLRDVGDVLAEHTLSIIRSQTTTGTDRIANMSFEFELADVSQLDSVLSSVFAIQGVFDAHRVMPGRGSQISSQIRSHFN